MYIACQVVNNVVNVAIEVPTINDGIALIKEWIKVDGLECTEDTVSLLEETFIYYDDSNADYIKTYQVIGTG